MDNLKPYTYNITVVRVVDGDTFVADIDLGFNTWQRNVNVRLVGCNAIEKKEPGGAEAKANLTQRLPVGTQLLLFSVKYDKYGGRIDALVFELTHGGDPLPVSLAENLIAEGWAAPYTGKGPKLTPAWPRISITI